MMMAMPAITAKAANRLPLMPQRGRKKPNKPEMPKLNRNAAMPFAPIPLHQPQGLAGRQYRVTRLTKSGKAEGSWQFLQQKGRHCAGLSADDRGLRSIFG